MYMRGSAARTGRAQVGRRRSVSVGKWSSVILALAGAAAVAGGMEAVSVSAGAAIDVPLTAGGAIGAGLLLGGLQWLVMSRVGAEANRLTAHVEALAKVDNKTSALAARGTLGELTEAIDRCVGGLRKKIDQLTGQRKELEIQARLAEAERRHAEAILNTIADAVVVTDAFNEVALANESAARVLGFDLGEALRKPVDRIVHDPLLIKLIKDTREGGDASLRRHIEHKLGAAGSTSTYDVTLACVSDSQGASSETAGVVTILRDITKEKEIAEMKSDFVSNVSHELRTPLSSIKAYVEMLVDGEAEDAQTREEFYNIIQGEANRLGRLIDNILNISRIESGVVKVQRENVSLPALIKDVIDVMQPQARAKQIELSEVPTPLFFQVFADKDMIYQAILNLASNAIKYTPEKGKVVVSITVDEHAKQVNVSVSDNGVGIPPADLPHLFEKFYRVADHKKMAKGTGLGLNLVKHIIETVHGGKVSVTSEVGKGSTFTFSLPMAEGGY
jgi:two-component system, OmpR family, phosphate regulon sensor histidine kinase PhoR